MQVKLGDKEYDVTPPRRRVYRAEVNAEVSRRPVRAFAAALGLGCRGLWGTRAEPRYDGSVSAYGEAVYELLAAEGIDEDDIQLAGISVYREWSGLPSIGAEIKAAEDFGEAPAAASTVSGGVPS